MLRPTAVIKSALGSLIVLCLALWVMARLVRPVLPMLIALFIVAALISLALGGRRRT